MKTIYLGAGTFWLTEAIFKPIMGVVEVTPGYMGGELTNPSFESVATGNTGHAEVVKVIYDESIITTEDLLRIFYAMHDPAIPEHPTHGAGSQYRPVIFYTDQAEGEATDEQNGGDVGVIPRILEEVQASLSDGATISTHIVSAKEFYPAEEYHYNYFYSNPDAAFSMEVIAPKLDAVKQQFPRFFV